MVAREGIAIAVVGLGFGAEFVPIYLDHPDVAHVAICDRNEQRLQRVGERFGVAQRFHDLQALLASALGA